MHCGNTTFAYDSKFKEYMKVEGVVSEDIFDYFFDVGVEKFLSEKEKKYLLELFEKWDLEHLRLDEYFDDCPVSDGLEDIIRDEGMQNLKKIMMSLVIIKSSKKWLHHYCTILTSVRSVKKNVYCSHIKNQCVL